MATYDFTNSWDTETFIKDDDSYTFTQLGYLNAIEDAGIAGLAPTFGNPHGADLQSSFGNPEGSPDIDMVNFVDFDYYDEGSSNWTAMNNILGDDSTVGGYATAVDAEGTGFIEITSNFNGYNTFSSAAAGYGLAENKLFDLWHIDGLSDGDYVTAQIVGGDLTAANLSVWGEVDGYMTDAHNSDKLSWPYLNHDAIAIDTFNVDGDHSFGEFTYTLNIITDWNDVGEDDYGNLDWGYIFTAETTYVEYSDMYWGYIDYNEFNSYSYDYIDWGYAEFNEFGADSYNQLDWGEVSYKEFNYSSYVAIDWGYIQFGDFDSGDYIDAHWGNVQYDEFDKKEYIDCSWNKVQMNELGNDDYVDINWGEIQYNEVLKSNANLNTVDWGKVETNEWDKKDLKLLTKKSTDKKLDKLKKAELDINVLKKKPSYKGDKDDDVITTAGKLLKKKVSVKGGKGNDTFVLKKGKGSMLIKDFKDKVDEINFAYCGAAKKIKLKQQGKDTLIYAGKDLLATVEKTKKKKLQKSAFGLV